MRGAYGKPNGLCARVNINQVMISSRTDNGSSVGLVSDLAPARR